MTTAAGLPTVCKLPFSIGVLSDLSAGQNKMTLRDRRFHEVNPESFDNLLSRKRPTVPVELSFSDAEGDMQTTTSQVSFSSIVDFEPEAIAQRIPKIAEVVRVKTSLANLLSAVELDYNLEDVIREFMVNPDLRGHFKVQGADALQALPCWIQASSRVSLERHDELTAQIADFIEYGQWFKPRVVREPINLLRGAVHHADAEIQRLLGQVLGNEEIRRLEVTWRSLYYLVYETSELSDVRIAVLDCSRREITRDFTQSVEVDQSVLYRRIVDENFNTIGARPYGLLIGDYEFCHLPTDVDVLQRFADLCEAAQAVFVTCASPVSFDLTQMSKLHKIRDLATNFNRTEFARWRAFRTTLSARRIAMVLPRFLLREPYENVAFSHDPVTFVERDHGDAASRSLWANGGFALAVAAARSLQRTGWFCQMRGTDSATPLTNCISLPEVWAANQRTETSLTEAQITDLLDLGFTSLCSAEGSLKMGFAALVTCHNRKLERAAERIWHKPIGSSLEALLCFGRLVHHLKRVCQEKLSVNFDNDTNLQIINTWVKTVDFSESSLHGEMEFEFEHSPGSRLFHIHVTIACREGESMRSLTTTVPLLLG